MRVCALLVMTMLACLALPGLAGAAQDHPTQAEGDLYAEHNELFERIYAAGEDHDWTEDDGWTREQQEWLWKAIRELWIEDVRAIVDYVVATYASLAPDMLGVAEETLAENDGLRVALGMAVWGFGEINEDGMFVGTATEKEWALEDGSFPTLEAFYEETYVTYGGDPVAYWDMERADTTDVFEATRSLFIDEFAEEGEPLESGSPNTAPSRKP